MFGSKLRKSLPKQGIKKMDAVITGLILGGIVASIYGIKKTEEYQDRKSESFTKTNKFSLYSILKMLVFGVEVEKTQKPASLSQKLLSIFRWNR